MDFEKLYPLIRSNILPIVLGIFGLLFVMLGLFQMVLNKPKTPPFIFEEAKEERKQEIMVDIEGSVISPGVYKLPEDSRIVDVLAAAGGISEDADREWVEKNINLAKKAFDGLKIYIPRTGEQVLSVESEALSTLNINTATQSDLEALPGIGPVTASKIIDARPYSSIEELTSKKILGSSVFAQIKDKISAN